MKKIAITTFLTLALLGAPAFAENTAPQTDAPTDVKKPKIEIVLTKNQKIEADLRSNITKLQAVIDRTSNIIKLLDKNGKDTSDASVSLSDASSSLNDASSALDQFAGIVPVTPKGETPKEIKKLKDPLKKAQDSIKDARSSLGECLNELKDILNPKTDNE